MTIRTEEAVPLIPLPVLGHNPSVLEPAVISRVMVSLALINVITVSSIP